jgi:hypothetical protein
MNGLVMRAFMASCSTTLVQRTATSMGIKLKAHEMALSTSADSKKSKLYLGRLMPPDNRQGIARHP